MRVLCSQAVDVHAPAEAIFDYICDLPRWPTWFTCVVSAQQPDNRPLALGEEIHVCLHAGRRRWQEDLEITRFMRNAFLSFEALFSAARRIDFRFERRGKITRLACSIGYLVSGGMLPSAFDALVARRRIDRGLRESLVHLKNVLEEHAGVTEAPDDLDALAVAPVAKPAASVAAQQLRVGQA
jgi:uncharacterized membrane protein